MFYSSVQSKYNTTQQIPVRITGLSEAEISNLNNVWSFRVWFYEFKKTFLFKIRSSDLRSGVLWFFKGHQFGDKEKNSNLIDKLICEGPRPNWITAILKLKSQKSCKYHCKDMISFALHSYFTNYCPVFSFVSVCFWYLITSTDCGILTTYILKHLDYSGDV